MVLSEKETAAIKDLQTQEKTCVEKYSRYSKEAKDPVLVNLFTDLHKKEQQHFDSLGQVLNGTVPNCNCNDSDGKNYNPTATYSLAESEDKKNDCFLATDCIGTEKLVSSEYNTDVFGGLQTRASANCSQTFRWRSRIMRRCSISIRLSTACHKADKVSCIREVPVQRVLHAGLFLCN